MTKQNKEELALKKKQWYEKNKDKIKQYYLDNKERINIQQTKHRQDNQTKYNEYNMRKFKCNCGSTYSYSQKARHERTNKHIKYISNQSL